ncbi:tetratricopeptide repeat-containing sensor histidine kinase [Aquimarina muelleri]|uniref:Signal transduction histidine kinase internal region domain-containing protein n=1 Tax=Aquimarina muelleri TaxID=279356 RepID=A0A918JR26_9FLAO|nr:tetratricopeptide repeat protein [Aquimarina muelleri]MCX2762052.1 tetratricopeptide repeat protein [Aquimarina muelleri]GGX04088.1 hypothetical protein GCM10007384_02340 [Aquimarina muelleri]
MKTLFIIFIVFSSFGILAQSNTNNIKQIELKLAESKELFQKNLDSSLYYSNSALQLSTLIKNDTLIAKSHLQKSSVLILKKRFSEADSLLQNNLNKDLPKHIKGQTLHNLATIQYYKQDFEKALGIYLKAAKILEQAKNSKQLVNTYTNIGSINAALKNFKNAQKYLERALPLSEFNEMIKLQILVNLCNIYLEQKMFKKYTDNIFEAEKLAKKYNSKNTLSVIYTNLSNYYTENDTNYDLALTYGKKAISLKKELNQIQTINVTYNNVGHSYLKKGEYKKAIAYMDSAMIGAQGILKTYIYNNLKDSYLGINNYKKALFYADLKDFHKDSIVDAKQKEKVAELTEKFESEKQQQQIDILDSKNQIQALTIKQQNYILVALIVFALLLLILGYFGFKNYKTKQKLNTLLLQQKLRKIQLNPHFLFNALQSIQNFIHQNDKEKSSSYLTSYSKLIRLILEKSDHDFISVAEDKQALEAYLDLQKINQNNVFSYTIQIQNNVEEDFDILPPLITQPFVENAILHGLKDKTEGLITIKYYKNNTDLCVSIKDNGRGFEIHKEDSKKLHKSMSMQIVREQLKNLNKTSKKINGNVSIGSSPKGTEVVLTFAAA